jgi:predicted PurR-regulated permease PerM
MRLDAGLRTVLTVAGLFVVVAGLRESSALFLPLLTGLFIAVISMPVMILLEKARVPRVVAISLTVLLDIAVLAGVIALVSASLTGFNDALPRYQSAIGQLASDTVGFLRDHGVPVEQSDLDTLGDPAWFVTIVADLFRELTSLVSSIVLVMLLVVFMLFEIAPGAGKLRVLLGGPHADLHELADAAGQLQRYLVVKTYLSAVTGTLCGVWLGLVGVDFPLLWGLLTFLLNYVPSVGAAIAGIPPVLVALLTLGPGAAAAAAIGFLAVNFVIGNFFEPRMMGVALGLSTLVVFVSMLFWGWLWGPLGALFAVPLTMLLRSALAVSEETRWLAVLLSSSEWVDKHRFEWGWLTVEERSSGGTLVSPTPKKESDILPVLAEKQEAPKVAEAKEPSAAE